MDVRKDSPVPLTDKERERLIQAIDDAQRSIAAYYFRTPKPRNIGLKELLFGGGL